MADSWFDTPHPPHEWVRRASVGDAHPKIIADEGSGIWVRTLFPQFARLPANRDDPNRRNIDEQIDELRQHALEESEQFSEDSAVLAARFCHELAANYPPSIFLLANGNLRAVWRNRIKDQIGLQFFPEGLIQFVILRDRDGSTLKALGEEVDHEKIYRMVEVQELLGLWFSGKR